MDYTFRRLTANICSDIQIWAMSSAHISQSAKNRKKNYVMNKYWIATRLKTKISTIKHKYNYNKSCEIHNKYDNS